MSKILVADLLDTLIPEQTDSLNHLYGDRCNVDFVHLTDEVCEYWNKLKYLAKVDMVNNLRNFLSEGNELVIVSNLGHSGFDDIVNDYIRFLYEHLNEYSDNIKVILMGKDYDLDTHKIIKEGENIYFDCDGLKIGFVYDKRDAYAFIEYKEKDMYVIGNDPINDSDMILTGYYNGSNIALIDYDLSKPFLNKVDSDEIRHYIFSLVFQKQLLGYDSKTERRLLHDAYRKGILSSVDIYALDDIYTILNRCDRDIIKRYIGDIEQIEKIVNSFKAYSSFKEYNERVLMRK